MAQSKTQPTGKERFLDEEELIVSKTDLRGVMTYVNDVFRKISGYTECELIGKAHNLIRHPDMPRCVFKLLWQQVEAQQEIFAYVKNMAKSGDHYWVFAHVTPSYDLAGKHIGYHSNRRKPDSAAVKKIESIYQLLLKEERRHSDPKQALSAGTKMLGDYLASQKTSYGPFVFGLSDSTSLEASV